MSDALQIGGEPDNVDGGFITQVDIEEGVQEGTIAAYRVEDAEIPHRQECRELVLERTMIGSTTNPVYPLPRKLPLEKVKRNIANNLDFDGKQRAKMNWFKIFTSPAVNALIADIFWYAICFYFKSGQHEEIEDKLKHRISINYVALFAGIPQSKKDFFFAHFPDAIAQAVLYCMFLAYPKSRNHFTAEFRKDLLIKVAWWFTGIVPEFVSISHWKLNLGGGDVLQSVMSMPSEGGGVTLSAPGVTAQLPALADMGDPDDAHEDIKSRPPRPIKTLRYSPLIKHFVKSQGFTSANLIPDLKIALTEAETHVKQLDRKHGKLINQALAAKRMSFDMMAEYETLHQKLRQEENQLIKKTKAAQQNLDQRKKEVLRKAPHDFANYLVSLKLLQTE